MIVPELQLGDRFRTWAPSGKCGARVCRVADSNGSVYKTTTSGASWFPASTGLDQVGVRALAVDPFDANYVWAGTSSGLYRSANAGGSCSKLNIASDGSPARLQETSS